MLDKPQTEGEQIAEGHRVDLVAQVDRLALDLHAMKGNLAANTEITFMTADSVAAIKETLAKIDVPALIEALQAVQAMKGGVKVLGWIERPAKWVAAVSTACAALWAVWHNWGK